MFVLHVVDLLPFRSEVIPINDGFSFIGFFLKIVPIFNGLQKIISDPCLNLAFDFISDKRSMFISHSFNNTDENIARLV